MDKITSVKIAKIAEMNFTCPNCNKCSQLKYHVTINDNQTDEMCLDCHNKISSNLFQSEKLPKTSKRRTRPVFKWMYGDEDESKEIWNKYCT